MFKRRRILGLALVPAMLLVALGVTLAGVGKAALDHTNTTEFCISCHEMKANNFEEYSHTIHARNRTGVKTGCSDCHVPHEFPDVLWRKIGAGTDVLHHLLGTLDTKEKFEARRLELAKRVWLRMKTTDSAECRHCHDAGAMNSELQGQTAQKQHKRMAGEGKTCIDCHFGIAHHEPGQGAEPADVVASPSPAAASKAP